MTSEADTVILSVMTDGWTTIVMQWGPARQFMKVLGGDKYSRLHAGVHEGVKSLADWQLFSSGLIHIAAEAKTEGGRSRGSSSSSWGQQQQQMGAAAVAEVL